MWFRKLVTLSPPCPSPHLTPLSSPSAPPLSFTPLLPTLLQNPINILLQCTRIGKNAKTWPEVQWEKVGQLTSEPVSKLFQVPQSLVPNDFNLRSFLSTERNGGLPFTGTGVVQFSWCYLVMFFISHLFCRSGSRWLLSPCLPFICYVRLVKGVRVFHLGQCSSNILTIVHLRANLLKSVRRNLSTLHSWASVQVTLYHSFVPCVRLVMECHGVYHSMSTMTMVAISA